jgi:glycosyltransferase involved in cell wall biosynthesis
LARRVPANTTFEGKSKVKIAMVVTAKTRGGVYTNVRDITLGLHQRGHEVVIFVDEALSKDFAEDLKESPGIKIKGLRDAVRERCDVWHLHLHDSFHRNAFSLQVQRLILRGRRNILLDEHLPRTPRSDSQLAYEPDTPPGRKKPFAKQLKGVVKRLQFFLCGKVMVHSRASSDFLRARYATPLRRIVLVPYGVPITPALEAPAPSERLRILLLAVVCFRKGHDLLIEATRYAKTPWDVVFVGGGSQMETFQALATERAMQTVRFAGQMNNPGAAVAACDVLCVPSRSDASSISGLEAMMAGKPLVVSTADGVPELIDDGITGLVVDATIPQALAEALDKLADPELRASMGRSAREVMLATRTFDHMIEATIAAYQGLQ